MSSHTYQSSSAQSSTQSSSGSSDAMGLQENLGNQALLSMMSGTDLDYMEDAGNQEVLAMMGLSGSYTVQSGDSLSSIASRYDGTWQDLYDANRSQISDPNKISVGMTLTLPSGWTGGSSTPSSSHTVQSGDSLSSIADGYGQGWWDLYDANRSQISDPNKISVGMVLTIPSAWLSVTPTPEPEPEVLAPSSYTIRSGDTLSKIAALYGKDWSELYDANRSQISDPNKISVGMVLTIPSGWIGGTETETGTETGTGTDSGTVGGGNPDLVDSGPYSSVYAPDSSDTSLIVDRGQLTFDAEGTEGGTYHTRTAHWPGGNSGVTIGRGYDMGYRDYDEVYATLVGAGVSASDASALAQGAGLQGTSAQDFISSRSLPEISMKAQKTLFDEVYAVYIGYVVEISDRSDVVAKYGQVNWETLSPWILDLVVDMRYRGDYTVDTREVVQPYMVSNDVSGLSGVMNDRSLWLSVPEDRYNRRAAWMQEAELAQEQKPFDSEGDL
ncbi:MAG: LysM repeat protein, partial [Myxococcota bacterium]